MKKNFNFNLGADPEFIITLNNTRLAADEMISFFLKKKASQKELKGYRFPGGEIGWDGATSTGELRPDPAKSPANLTKNIESLLKSIAKGGMDNFSFLSTSSTTPLGGHIHLELPLNRKIDTILLSQFIGSLIWPFINDNILSAITRQKEGYGRLLDAKADEKRSNGHTTFEYRGLSSEWLTSPLLTTSVFSFLGVIFHEFKRNKTATQEWIKKWGLKNELQDQAATTINMSHFSPVVNIMEEKIKRQVRTFALYPNFKEEIEIFFNKKKKEKIKKDAQYNILRGWNIIPPLTPGKFAQKTLLRKKKKEKGKKIAIFNPILKKQTKVIVTEDSLSGLRKQIHDRMLYLGWILPHTIHLATLPDGIEKPIVFNGIGDILQGAKFFKTKDDWQSRILLFNKKFSDQDKVKKIINSKTEQKQKEAISQISPTQRNSLFFLFPQQWADNTKKILSTLFDVVEKVKAKKLIPTSLNFYKMPTSKVKGKLSAALSAETMRMMNEAINTNSQEEAVPTTEWNDLNLNNLTSN